MLFFPGWCLLDNKEWSRQTRAGSNQGSSFNEWREKLHHSEGTPRGNALRAVVYIAFWEVPPSRDQIENWANDITTHYWLAESTYFICIGHTWAEIYLIVLLNGWVGTFWNLQGPWSIFKLTRALKLTGVLKSIWVPPSITCLTTFSSPSLLL